MTLARTNNFISYPPYSTVLHLAIFPSHRPCFRLHESGSLPINADIGSSSTLPVVSTVTCHWFCRSRYGTFKSFTKEEDADTVNHVALRCYVFYLLQPRHRVLPPSPQLKLLPLLQYTLSFGIILQLIPLQTWWALAKRPQQVLQLGYLQYRIWASDLSTICYSYLQGWTKWPGPEGAYPRTCHFLGRMGKHAGW